jgi:hypothetical protein
MFADEICLFVSERDVRLGGGGGGRAKLPVIVDKSELWDLFLNLMTPCGGGLEVDSSLSESLESNTCFFFLRRSLDLVRSASVSCVSTSEVNCASLHFCRALL